MIDAKCRPETKARRAEEAVRLTGWLIINGKRADDIALERYAP